METINRRKFVKQTVTAAAALAVPASVFGSTTAPLQFTQLPLPYTTAALEPYIDGLTMDIHYSKHHAAYIKNINEAIAAENISFTTEKEFFANTSKLSAKARNNGGGAWNHNFFWQVMKPGASGTPYGKVVAALDGAFGSVPKFIEQFNAAAMSRFGSGWAWLVKDGNTLKVGSTPNQDNPLMDVSELKGTPLLALDVWEHAYYLKYQNKRNEYIANWWNVVNWDEVAKRLN
ncbi:MAG: superoxide dismutase [Cyclobacteriaceae bacterium]|nr:superoxide dismutase [Cyclobacteriaceae bacterium]